MVVKAYLDPGSGVGTATNCKTTTKRVCRWPEWAGKLPRWQKLRLRLSTGESGGPPEEVELADWDARIGAA